jgi:hypothetical protein
LKPLPFSILSEILGHRSLTLDSEYSFYDFISKGLETNRETFGLPEFGRLGYCLTEVMNNFWDLLYEYCYEINASIWAGIRARLVLCDRPWTLFPPAVKKRTLRYSDGSQSRDMYDIPGGITAHLTREWHIRGCEGRGVRPHPAGEGRQESQRVE